MINVGICGLGYWGPKLLRNFASNPGFRPVAIAERRDGYRNNATMFDPNEAGANIVESIGSSREIACGYRADAACQAADI